MTTRKLIDFLVNKRGWVPLKAIQYALDLEDDGLISPD